MTAEIDQIISQIEEQLSDLHLLFTHDVVVMDITFYNAVNLSLNRAKEEIVESQRQYYKRMNAIAKQLRNNPSFEEINGE